MHAPTSPTHTNGPTAFPAPEVGPPPGSDAKPQAADGGRDAHGRFATGNAGGPGNPFARRVAALRSALLSAVSDEDIQAVAEQLVRQAREGNLAAARLLLSYALGKPAAAVDPDTLDQQEWEQYRRLPDPAPEMFAAPRRLTLPLGLDFMRTALPALADSQRGMVLDGLKKMEAKDRAREQRRAGRKATKAARSPAAPEAAMLNQLLAMAQQSAPSANGSASWASPRHGDRTCQAVPPPSANGGASWL